MKVQLATMMAVNVHVQRILSSNTPSQGTEAWLRWRKMRLTASDACSLTGDAVKTRASLLLSKTMPSAPSFQGNEFTRSGHINEPLAGERYRVESGRLLHTDLKPVLHPQYSWLAASLDGVTACGRNVEIKTLHAAKALAKPKPVHVKQANIQMACTGLQITDLVYYYVNIKNAAGMPKMDVHSIKYDGAWFNKVLPKLQSFAEDLAKAHACNYDIELEEWLLDNAVDEFCPMEEEEEQEVDIFDDSIVWPLDNSQAEWLL